MDYKSELIKCANAAGGYARDTVSDDFLSRVVNEIELLRQDRDRLKEKLENTRLALKEMLPRPEKVD